MKTKNNKKNYITLYSMLIFTCFILFLSFPIFSCSNSEISSADSSAKEQLIVSFQDSLSYALGVNFGKNLPPAEINEELLILGFNDFRQNKEPLLDAATRSEILMTFTIKVSEEERENQKKMSDIAKVLSRNNKMQGQEFLEKNKYKDGVKVLRRSGIQYKIIDEGSGNIPDFNDTVKVHFTGYFIDGDIFDSSTDKAPLVLKVSEFIPGWREVLRFMPVGSKWKVFIPYNLAYGETGIAKDISKNDFIIPPSSTLIFDIELIEILK